jgi:hypothetical protein
MATAPQTDHLAVLFETTRPAIGMSEAKFRRIKERIENEIKTTLVTSLWVAIALALFAVGATLVIGLHSAELKPSQVGEFEVAYWACFIVGGMFMAVHFLTDRSAKDRAADFMKELETDLFKVPQPDARGRGAAPPELPPPTPRP